MNEHFERLLQRAGVRSVDGLGTREQLSLLASRARERRRPRQDELDLAGGILGPLLLADAFGDRILDAIDRRRAREVGRILELHDGKVYNVRLGQPLERGRDFDRVTFSEAA